MADTPFQYDDEVLSSCATSSYAEALLGSGGEIASKSRVNRVDLSCQKLFQQYASHYGRDRDAANDTQNHDRLHRFVSNLVFVYRHNNELLVLDDDETNEPAGDEDEDDDIDVAGTSAAPRHRITLNRFSDRHEHELPLMDEGVAEEFLPNFESLPLLGVENEYYGESRELGGAGSIFSKLEFEHLVQSVTATTTSSVAANIGAFRSYFLSDRHRFEDEVPPLPGSASSSSPLFHLVQRRVRAASTWRGRPTGSATRYERRRWMGRMRRRMLLLPMGEVPIDLERAWTGPPRIIPTQFRLYIQ